MTLLVWAGQTYLVQSRRQSSHIDLALLVEARRDLHKVRPTPTRINLLNNGKRLRRRCVRSIAHSSRSQDSHVNRRYRNQMKVSLSRITCMQNDRLRERRIADTRKPCGRIGEVQRRIERSGAAVISAASRQVRGVPRLGAHAQAILSRRKIWQLIHPAVVRVGSAAARIAYRL